MLGAIPQELRFNFPIAQQIPLDENGRIQFIGGRLLNVKDLQGVEGVKAGQLLWVAGKIPVWINLMVEDFDENYTFIEIHFNPQRLTANSANLMHEREGNPPFHILGPAGGKRGEKIHFRALSL